MKIKVVSITSEMISYHFTIMTDTINIFTPEEQFLLFSTIFYYQLLDFRVKTGDQLFTSRYAFIRDKRGRDNESRLYYN